MNTHAVISTGMTHTSAAAWAFLHDRGIDLVSLLDRHTRGDWGDVDLDDGQENGLSLVCGGPIVSRFTLSGTDGIRIVTDTLRKTTRISLATEPHALTGHAGHSFGYEALAA